MARSPDMHESVPREAAVGPGLLALGLLAIALTRAPQFLSGRLMLDGDESVVGVMAMHLLKGQGLPMFFYGQDYGFAPLEVGAAALFFACFGISVLAFKAAMLTLWSVGWLCWVAAVRRLAERRTAVFTGVLLATASAWGVISMKGWATWVTSFVALGVALLALSRLREPVRFRPVSAAVLGCAAAILWVTQVHTLLVLLPFCALYAVPARRWADLITATACCLVAVAAIRWAPVPEGVIRDAAPGSIVGRGLAALPAPAEAVRRLGERTHGTFAGAYHFSIGIDAGPFTQASGVAWLAALGAALLAVLLVGPLRRNRLAWCCVLASLPFLALAVLVLPETFQYRYLLPLTAVAALLVAACASWLLDTGAAGRALGLGVVAMLGGLGALSMGEFRTCSWCSAAGPGSVNESQALQDLVLRLERQGIHHVYTRSEMLRWKLAFASRERVTAGIAAPEDRYPEHARAFNEALVNGEPIALVGERYWMEELVAAEPPPGIPRPRITEIGPWILATYDVDPETLRALLGLPPASAKR